MTLFLAGASDFLQLRAAGGRYVDKTDILNAFEEEGGTVALFLRPRRFGKSLNLSTLAAWWALPVGEPTAWRATRQRAFAGTLAGDAPSAAVSARFCAHPVIALQWKDCKGGAWPTVRGAVARSIQLAAQSLRPLWDHDGVDDRVLLATPRYRDLPDDELAGTLRALTRALRQATGAPSLLLIDEYDGPLIEAATRGFYTEAIDLLRPLLGAALRDNPDLARAALTGVLRVSREGLFSGLNHVSVHGPMDATFGHHFGFTPTEVRQILQDHGRIDQEATVQRWYNGYQMAGQTLYNPWSIVSFVSDPSSRPAPYWVRTGSDELLKAALIGAGLGIQHELAALMAGEALALPLSDLLALPGLTQGPAAVWSLLLQAGYLTRADEAEPPRLRIPNAELRTVYEEVFGEWMTVSLAGAATPAALVAALLHGDAETAGALIETLLLRSMSFHDYAVQRPEAVYQAFLLGLLVHAEPGWRVRSNRESGYGPYDLMLIPRKPGQPGAVIELKVLARDGNVESTLRSALAQIADRRYADALREAGASPIWCWAATFDGKQAWVRAQPAP